jgi:hypothetical protein
LNETAVSDLTYGMLITITINTINTINTTITTASYSSLASTYSLFHSSAPVPPHRKSPSLYCLHAERLQFGTAQDPTSCAQAQYNHAGSNILRMRQSQRQIQHPARTPSAIMPVPTTCACSNLTARSNILRRAS